MNQAHSLLTILMDRKRHFREELLERIYQSRNGVQSGRLAARVDDLRKRGYEIDSPLIRYVDGQKVKVIKRGKKAFDKEFWYMLRGSKTIWKKIEKEWEERV